MLFQPTYIRPSEQWGIGNGTIDATENLTISWQVNGNSAMTAYKITIYANDSASTQKYTTGKITTNCPFYPVKYDGTTELFSHTISASTLSSNGITNGNEYKFTIQMWWSANDSITQSSASVFQTRNNPTLTLATIPSPLASRVHTFTATYSQTQGDALNFVRWQLADNSDNIIYDTQNIYGTSQLQFEYDGFFTGNTYKIKCSVQTEKGIDISTGWVSFSVSYETAEWASGLNATCTKDKSCVTLDWGSATYIPATEVGSGSIQSDHGRYYSMSSGDSIYWNTVNGVAMNFATPWSIALQGKINNTNGGDVLTVTMGSSEFEITYDASTYTLSITQDGTEITSWQMDMTEFIALITPTKIYLKCNRRAFGLAPSQTIVISDVLYPLDWHSELFYEDRTITYTQGNITKVELGNGASEISYLWVFEGNADDNTAVQNEILGASLTQYDYKPQYDNTTYMVADFSETKGTQAGTIVTTFTLAGFALYRQDNTNTVLKKIATLNASVQSVKDYSVASEQGTYKYYLFPLSASGTSASPIISNEINPMFWSWTLLECEKNSNGEYVVQNEFMFTSNISSSAISNNNKPNIVRNFTPYPTVQLSPHNYKSGTLTSLIGGVRLDTVSGVCRYVDTIELRNAIYNLSTKPTTLFLKNRKGDVLEIKISDAIDMATNDNSREQIQTMTLPWVEVGDAKEKTIIA